MPRIYLDPTVLVLPSGGPSSGGPSSGERAAPGAADAVARLVEAGFDVIVLGASSTDSLRVLSLEVTHEPELPTRLEADTWYLTAEPRPAFGRPRGGTTVLVGPRRPAGKVPLPRFDIETRDLASAAMEILTRQAMA